MGWMRYMIWSCFQMIILLLRMRGCVIYIKELKICLLRWIYTIEQFAFLRRRGDLLLQKALGTLTLCVYAL